METFRFKTRHNILGINSIQSFAGIKGGINHDCKDVYFIRCIGCNSSYFDDIQNMDSQLASRERKGQGKYIRVPELPKLSDSDDIVFYTSVFDQWEKSLHREIALKATVPNINAKGVVGGAFIEIQKVYEKYFPNASATMNKNFMIKLMFWSDNVIGRLLVEWNEKNTDKFVITGKITKQEYLFCYFITLLGIDVLMFMPAGEAEIDAGLLGLSMAVGHTGHTDYQFDEKSKNLGHGNDKNADKEPEVKEHEFKEPKVKESEIKEHGKRGDGIKTGNRMEAGHNSGMEMQFEELALLAASVVMITVHDGNGEVIGTGSGIMVGKKGYILTNNHVANGGEFYSVRIEDDEVPYQTDELIKYNQVLDLAVLRIDRKLNPIPLYKGGKPLVRGQKVVAIGSPLGLFNSVSNGIISGFRKIEDLDMIQFTAPISHGSSGGALLNTYGEVIGISTAGFDNGQNINLAVDYTCITDFIKGFI